MDSFYNSQQNNTNPLPSQNTSTEEPLGFGHFLDIASNFWSNKFDGKAQELQNEALILDHTQVLDYKETQQQFNQENSQDFLSDNFNENYKWNPSDDETLLELAFQYKCDWIKISKKFSHPNLSPRVFKDRYRQLFSVTLANKARFTTEEDRKIVKYFQIYGTNWKVISCMIPGRNPTTLKNRYYSSLRNKVQRYSSAPTSLTSSKYRNRIFSDLPRLQGGSFEDLGFSGQQQQNLQVDLISNIQQQSFDCDQFFAFENFTEPTAMTEEPKDLGYQQNLAPFNANVNQSRNYQQFVPSYDSNNVQRNQSAMPEFGTFDWNDDYKTFNEPVNNHPDWLETNISSKTSKTEQEAILKKEESASHFQEPQTAQKNPRIIINELNNRVQNAMSLCYQIQQEIERTREKAGNYAQPAVY